MIKKVAAAFLMTVSCSLVAVAVEGRTHFLSLEEVLSIGNFKDNVLFQWIGVSVDDDGFLYVTDGMDYSIKKFAPKGRLVRKAGRRGQGPGEFLAPRLLDCSGKYVYATDQSIPGIHVFDRNLTYLKRIPFSHPVGDLKAFADGRYAVTMCTVGHSGKVLLHDEKGSILKEYHYSDAEGPVMSDWASFDFDAQYNLYVAYNFQDRIEKFDAAGDKIWSRSILGIKKVPRKKTGPWEVPQSLVYKDLALDGCGRLYVLGGGFSRHRSRDVYVLSSEGEPQAVITLPEKSHCIHIDRHGYLYSRANDGITLKKYKITGWDARH